MEHICKKWAILDVCTKDSGRDYSTSIFPDFKDEETDFKFHWMNGDFSRISICIECGKLKEFNLKKSKIDIKLFEDHVKDHCNDSYDSYDSY